MNLHEDSNWFIAHMHFGFNLMRFCVDQFILDLTVSKPRIIINSVRLPARYKSGFVNCNRQIFVGTTDNVICSWRVRNASWQDEVVAYNTNYEYSIWQNRWMMIYPNRQKTDRPEKFHIILSYALFIFMRCIHIIFYLFSAVNQM